MQEYGKWLVLIGLAIAAIGAWLWSGRGFGWLGRLPGDIAYDNGNVRFYFPITTCIVISLVLSALAALFRR